MRQVAKLQYRKPGVGPVVAWEAPATKPPGIVAEVVLIAKCVSVAVPVVGFATASAETSQSPAVKLSVAIFVAAVPLWIAIATPPLLTVSRYSPTHPACALSLVCVP